MTDLEIFQLFVNSGTIGTQPDSSKVSSYFFEGNHIVFYVQSFHNNGMHKVTLAPMIDSWSSGIRAVCSCAKDKYWAFQYIRGSIAPRFYNYGNVGKGNTAPTVNNIALQGSACHHILSAAQYVLNNPGVLQSFSMYRQANAVRAFVATYK